MSTYRPKRVCPACKVGALWIRNSWSGHPLLATEVLQCRNILCGATYRAHREITHELVPPGIPNPALRVPRAGDQERAEAAQAARDRSEQQDDLFQAAPDGQENSNV